MLIHIIPRIRPLSIRLDHLIPTAYTPGLDSPVSLDASTDETATYALIIAIHERIRSGNHDLPRMLITRQLEIPTISFTQPHRHTGQRRAEIGTPDRG
jgi:hypothetical protein